MADNSGPFFIAKEQRKTMTGQRPIEANALAFAQPKDTPDTTGDPGVNAAFAQARGWGKEARHLQLLTLYRHRILRDGETNVAEFKILQSARSRPAEHPNRFCAHKLRLTNMNSASYMKRRFLRTNPESLHGTQ
jgi:hypothetical protein